MRALVEATDGRGLITFARVVTTRSFTMGLDASCDLLAHTPLDRPLDAEQVARIVETGSICSPPLVMMKGVADARAGATGPTLSLDNASEGVRRLHAAGATIIVDTDVDASPVPHGTGLHDELELLVQAGLTPTEALVAATPVRPPRCGCPTADTSPPACAPNYSCWTPIPTGMSRPYSETVRGGSSGSRCPEQAPGARTPARTGRPPAPRPRRTTTRPGRLPPSDGEVPPCWPRSTMRPWPSSPKWGLTA